MRWLVLVLIGCAHVPASDPEACPANMTRAQMERGAVECRAQCSSWGRDFHSFRSDCKCLCEKKYDPRVEQM